MKNNKYFAIFCLAFSGIAQIVEKFDPALLFLTIGVASYISYNEYKDKKSQDETITM